MAKLTVCNVCGKALRPEHVVYQELRTRAYAQPELVDEIDSCEECAPGVRSAFIESPGLDKLTTAAGRAV